MPSKHLFLLSIVLIFPVTVLSETILQHTDETHLDINEHLDSESIIHVEAETANFFEFLTQSNSPNPINNPDHVSIVKFKARKFAEDLKQIYSHINNFIKHIEIKSSLIEAMDMIHSLNTSLVCNSCRTFVSDFGKITNSQIMRSIIESIAYHACSLFANKTVCLEGVLTFGDNLIMSFFDKEFNPDLDCQQLRICQKDYRLDLLKDYVAEVLKDKPISSTPPKPTGKGSYKVLHLTDPHVDFEYIEGANAYCNEPLCCRAENGEAPNPLKASQYWGTIGKCDIPMRTFDEFLRYASENLEVDMIIWTGDNISHDIWHQSAANQTTNTYILTEAIEKYFPNIPVYPMFGNHEVYPADQFDIMNHTSDWLLLRLADIWKKWLGDEAFATFRDNSYYSIYNNEHNIKIIALDTQACDSANFYLIRNASDPLNQLAWLRNELYDAEKNDKSVFIIGHIPPGDSTCDSAWAARYRALIDRFGHIIRGQFFGHTHTDEMQIVRSYEDDSPVGVIYVTPSLTTFSSLYPSFRVYEVDTDTNILINYDQYRLNLTKWNELSRDYLEWDTAYNFLNEYNVSDMAPKTIDSLVENFRKNEKIISLYVHHLTSGSYPITKLSRRTESVIQQYYCFAKHSVYSNALRCMGFDASFEQVMAFFIQNLPGKWYSLLKPC